MALHWDDGLLLGNTEIDGHHRQIFGHFEKLSLACQAGVGEEVLKELLSDLNDYVNIHFSAEESFMVQHNYPKLSEQQGQHTIFRKIVNDLHEMALGDKDLHQLSIIVDRQLILWFIQHIKHSDQDMANYISAQLPESALQ